jgi:hypothetical protein
VTLIPRHHKPAEHPRRDAASFHAQFGLNIRSSGHDPLAALHVEAAP